MVQSSEELLLMAAENLKRSIELTVRQLEARKVRSEMKLRWSRSLTRQVQALVIVAEALNKIGSRSTADLDLASYLSAVESRVPRTYSSRRFALVVSKTRMSVGRHAYREV
jgi:two-component sensor histidine kinase